MADVLPPSVLQTVPQQIPPQRLEGEQLEEAVIKQIDYYFSRQNLANDAYLVSQMDADMCVPIATIAGFKKVHMLTSDADFIAKIMAKSQHVVVDTARMILKPNWKLQRNTLILRDIAFDAPVEEVKQIFGDKFHVVDAHGDIGDTWFVSFDNEESALAALDYVRDATFRGKAVKARIKAEHLLKSGGVQPQYTNAPYVDPALYGQYRGYVPQGYPGRPYWESQPDGKDRRGGYRGNNPRRNQAPSQSPPAVALPTLASQAPAQAAPSQPRTPRGGQAGAAPVDGPKPRSARKGKKNQTHVQFNGPIGSVPTIIVPELTQQHFPSLTSPSSNGKPLKATFKSGYEDDFRRFSKSDIVRIIQNVHDVATRPATIIVAEPGVVEQKPNTELEVVKVRAPEPLPPAQEFVPDTPAPTIVAAPGVAVREWPVEKRNAAPPQQVFVPKKTQPAPTPSAAEPAAQPTPTPAPSTTLPSSVTPASPSPAVARKATEQSILEKDAQGTAAPAPNSPSPTLSTSSDGSNGIRLPTYADIALRIGRTGSPPIGKPALTTSSPSLSSSGGIVASTPEGKTQ